MSWYRHEVVIATFDHELRLAARQIFKEVGEEMLARFSVLESPGLVLLPSPVNGFTTIMLGPDGGRRHRAEADAGDAIRDLFVEKLETLYGEEGQKVRWAEVRYGDEMEQVPRVTRHDGWAP